MLISRTTAIATVIASTFIAVFVVAIPAQAMDVIVQPQSGSSAIYDVEPSSTVAELKSSINTSTGADPSTICLVFDNQFLENTHTLSAYGIEADNVINQYTIPSIARWTITPDDPYLNTMVYNYVETIPLPSTTFAVIDGALPQGVTLGTTSGIVEGTFAQRGPFSVTIQATNTCGSAAIHWEGNVISRLANTGFADNELALIALFAGGMSIFGAAFIFLAKRRTH